MSGSASPRDGRAERARTLQMGEQRQQIRRCDHLDTACPGRFRPLRHGTDQPLVLRRGMERSQKHARRRSDPPVQPQLTDGNVMRQGLPIACPDRRQQAKSDGQVEVRPFFRQIGGRQVDGDPLGRKREPDGRKRRTHPLTTFRDRLVGKADDDEGGHVGGQLDLDLDSPSLQPQICNGGDDRDHHPRASDNTALTLRKIPPGSAPSPSRSFSARARRSCPETFPFPHHRHDQSRPVACLCRPSDG